MLLVSCEVARESMRAATAETVVPVRRQLRGERLDELNARHLLFGQVSATGGGAAQRVSALVMVITVVPAAPVAGPQYTTVGVFGPLLFACWGI